MTKKNIFEFTENIFEFVGPAATDVGRKISIYAEMYRIFIIYFEYLTLKLRNLDC